MVRMTVDREPEALTADVTGSDPFQGRDGHRDRPCRPLSRPAPD